MLPVVSSMAVSDDLRLGELWCAGRSVAVRGRGDDDPDLVAAVHRECRDLRRGQRDPDDRLALRWHRRIGRRLGRDQPARGDVERSALTDDLVVRRSRERFQSRIAADPDALDVVGSDHLAAMDGVRSSQHFLGAGRRVPGPRAEQAAERGDDHRGDDETRAPSQLGRGSDRWADIRRTGVGAGLPVLSGSRGHVGPSRAVLVSSRAPALRRSGSGSSG